MRRWLSLNEVLQQELDALTAGWGCQPTPRVRHRHNFHPVTGVCRDCTVTEIEHHNVPYGKGLPCDLVQQVQR